MKMVLMKLMSKTERQKMKLRLGMHGQEFRGNIPISKVEHIQALYMWIPHQLSVTRLSHAQAQTSAYAHMHTQIHT